MTSSARSTAAELNRRFQLRASALPPDVRERSIVLLPGALGRTALRGELRAALAVLLVLTGLALALACVNVASLAAVRSAAREKEMSIRLALGAGRWRLRRQRLTEGLVLAGLGGVIGLLNAPWLARALASAQSTRLVIDSSFEPRMVLYGFVLSLVAACVVALPPVRAAGRIGGRVRRFAVQDGVVPLQIAMALAMLVLFRALRIPLVSGREFGDEDGRAARPVVIVNERFAQLFWPGQGAIGQTLRVPESGNPPAEVVGVVRDVKIRDLRGEAGPMIYRPVLQGRSTDAMTLHVRAAGENAALVSALRLTIQELAVRRRTRDIGIHLALGASRVQVARAIGTRGAALIAIGVGFGLIGAFGVTHVAGALLFGAITADVPTFGAMAALLTAVSLFALSIPLRAATRIDVLTAIREEDLALATLFVAEQLHRVGARRRGDAPSAVRMPNAQIDNTEY